MITPLEIKIVVIATVIGVANWFIFSGAKDWWVKTFPETNTFFVGVFIVAIFMFLYKYRGALPFRL